MRSTFAILLLSAFHAAWPRAAIAHFGPAEPPDFGAPECIVVVDKQTTPEILLSYDLGYDDTEPEIGHIWLSDSKTHQFFAFRGSVVASLPRYEYRSFVAGAPATLPLWIDGNDVQRAEAANDPSTVVDFQPATIGDNLLHGRQDIADQWLAISTSPARVPITLEQAAKGVRWDLTAVPAGVYQIVGYTFSPPYNAWETRPGVIKVVAGADDPPAITLESIDAILYAGQGQRVTGCIDAPAGSTLSASYRVEGEPEMEANWHPWVTRTPVVNGKLDLCFTSPEAPLSEMIHLRVAVQAPDGREVFGYSPDSLVLVGTQASCTPSATQCCEVTPPPMATTAEPPPPTPGASSAPTDPMAGAAAAVQPTAAQPPAAEADGCAALPSRERDSTPGFGWLFAGLLAMRARRRSFAKPR